MECHKEAHYKFIATLVMLLATAFQAIQRSFGHMWGTVNLTLPWHSYIKEQQFIIAFWARIKMRRSTLISILTLHRCWCQFPILAHCLFHLSLTYRSHLKGCASDFCNCILRKHACGAEKIAVRVSQPVSTWICFIFRQSYECSVFPLDWSSALVMALFKKRN